MDHGPKRKFQCPKAVNTAAWRPSLLPMSSAIPRLMENDETGTLARLRMLRRDIIDPSIAAHSGRMVKLMGDGALVEFASAIDAVTCAVDIQKSVHERNAGEAGDKGDLVSDRHQCRRHHRRR